jgi:lysophospholipase L1-like esterase
MPEVALSGRINRFGMKKNTVRLAFILLPIILLLMMESCARTVITIRQDFAPAAVEQQDPLGLPSRELGWERFRELNVALQGNTGLPRIVAIGDSNTWGWGVRPDVAWTSVLARALPNATVVNMATPGYSSFQGYRTLWKYGERLRPSVLIASFNFNDRAYDHHIDSEQKFAQYFDAQEKVARYEWLNKIYMTRVLRYMLRKVGFIRPEHQPTVDFDKIEARVPPENYRENLRKIVEWGRERKIPVIFILLKDNPYYTQRIRAGIDYRERSDYEHATRAFSIGMMNIVSGTLARKYLVQTYEAMGNKAKADETAHMEGTGKGSLFVGQPIYLDQVYNEIMMEVGRELDVKVVDARPMLDSDPDMFLDMCHPDEIGHARIAALVLQALETVAPALTKGAQKMVADIAVTAR